MFYFFLLESTDNISYKYGGSEMMTLVELAKYLNMTISPVINDYDYWGEIWENRSGNGLLGNLVENRADIGAGTVQY